MSEPITPALSYIPKVLDITSFMESSQPELHSAVVKAVDDLQRVIIQEPYNELLITKKQFEILQKDPAMLPMYASNQFLYRTPNAIMEIRVKE